jgi:hypothetical protein
MTAPVPQINLYRIDTAEQAIVAGARLLLLVVFGTMLIVTALALGGEFYLAKLSAERKQAAAELRVQQARVEALRTSLPSPVEDPFLRSELERLERQHRQLSANLDLLGDHTAVNGQGFAPVFSGLARHTLEGIWLSGIGVSSAGGEMWLRGQTVEPALVPRLLQTLSEEATFSGRAFRRVSFERRETDRGSLVDFELRSAEAAEGGDAG